MRLRVNQNVIPKSIVLKLLSGRAGITECELCIALNNFHILVHRIIQMHRVKRNFRGGWLAGTKLNSRALADK